MKKAILLFSLVVMPQVAPAQTASGELPCSYYGELLRDDAGNLLRFTFQQMKARATHKVDISPGFMGYRDFRATIILKVLVGANGKVLCTKSVLEFPVADAEVEKAVRQWKFKPARKNGKPVASLGLLRFYLCNISCGKEGMSMSLLQ